MSILRVLSVDTAYDRILKLFSTSRKKYYRQLDENTDYQITQLSGLGVSKENFYEQCALTDSSGETYFTHLTISSHGKAGQIFFKSFGDIDTLVSEEDPDDVLQLVARNRNIYLLACSAAEGQLVQRLKANGALTVVGFTDDPRWGGRQGNEFWRSIDRQILDCISAADYAGQVRSTLQDIGDQINANFDVAGTQFASDLRKAQQVINSAVVI